MNPEFAIEVSAGRWSKTKTKLSVLYIQALQLKRRKLEAIKSINFLNLAGGRNHLTIKMN